MPSQRRSLLILSRVACVHKYRLPVPLMAASLPKGPFAPDESGPAPPHRTWSGRRRPMCYTDEPLLEFFPLYWTPLLPVKKNNDPYYIKEENICILRVLRRHHLWIQRPERHSWAAGCHSNGSTPLDAIFRAQRGVDPAFHRAAEHGSRRLPGYSLPISYSLPV